MPSFRQRPLTWLFWIATLCVDVVGATRHNDADWFAALMFGQLYVLSGWTAVGRMHRLARAGLFLAAPLAMAFVVWLGQRSPDEATAVLAESLILGVLTLAFTGAVAALIRIVSRKSPNSPRGRWQISIAELLGWMIVVAIASATARIAKLPPLDYVHGLWGTLASTLPPATLLALFLTPNVRHDRIGTALSAVVMIVYFISMGFWSDLDERDLTLFAGVFAYVALFVLVLRLDEQADVRPEGPRYDSPGRSPG